MSTPPANLPLLQDPTAYGGRTFTPAVSLDIASLQGAVVGQLSQSFAGTPVGVFGYPDVPTDDWWDETGAIGYLLVAYVGAQYSEPKSTDSMVQERRADFKIIVIARQISWADFSAAGVFQALLQVAKGSLTGFRPPGWRNCYLTSEGFDEQDPQGGIWLYSLKYRAITFEIKQPQPQVDAALALLKQITFIETSGDSAVPIAAAQFTFGPEGVLQLPAENVTDVTVTDLPTARLYVAGVDYTVQQAQGTLTVVQGGGISAGETVSVSYSTGDVVIANEQGGSIPFNPSN